MSDLLEIDSIRKEFGLRQILTDICLSGRTGDVIGILGRNGSGKSTLMKIIFGTLNAENKFIRLNGVILEKPYNVKNSIGYLCQDGFLPRNLTVRQVFEYYAYNIEVTGFFEDDILRRVQDVKIRNLSGGESRYLEIKLILSLECSFILLDEPFNGLSPLLIEIIKEMIVKMSEKKGIMLTDHDYRNVMDITNRTYLLFDGGLKQIRSREDLVVWGYVPG